MDSRLFIINRLMKKRGRNEIYCAADNSNLYRVECMGK